MPGSNPVIQDNYRVCEIEQPIFSFRKLLSNTFSQIYKVHDLIKVKSFRMEDYLVLRTCGNFIPPVEYSYSLIDPMIQFPTNVTGQLFINRIDYGPLYIKGSWEIVVTGTIP